MLQSNEVHLDSVGQINIARETSIQARKQQTGIVINALLGGTAGGILGIVVGLFLISGLISGLSMFAAFGITVPLLLGVFLSGIGTIAGSFVELLPRANRWRHR